MKRIGLMAIACSAAFAAPLELAASTPAARLQEPPKDPLADLPAPPAQICAARLEDRAAESAARIATRAAEVMTPQAVRAYARRMRLSEAQKSHLAALYLAYRAGVETLYAQHGPRISELAVAGAANSNYDFEFVKTFAELREREQAYERDLIRLEDRLFADLMPTLAEEQWPLLDAVKLLRTRDRCSALDIEIYEARIDLTAIIEKAMLDDDTLRDLEPLLLEYERAITPLWLDIHEQADKNEVENSRLTAMRMFRDDGSRIEPPVSDADRARGEAARIERQRINAASIPKQDRLTDINKRFLPRVLDLIPEPGRTRVQADFLSRAHSRVYPDRNDPKPLLDAALEGLPADAEARLLIQAAWDRYRSEYDALTASMVEGVRRWNRHMALTNTQDFEPVRAVREARFKRWEASEKFVDQMLALLPPESASTLQKQVENYRQRLNSEREREKDPHMANP